jgi:hypothetical protein
MASINHAHLSARNGSQGKTWLVGRRSRSDIPRMIAESTIPLHKSTPLFGILVSLPIGIMLWVMIYSVMT